MPLRTIKKGVRRYHIIESEFQDRRPTFQGFCGADISNLYWVSDFHTCRMPDLLVVLVGLFAGLIPSIWADC